MHLAALATCVARRTLDLLLVLLIVLVLAMLLLARGLPLATDGQTFVVGGRSMEPAIGLGSVVHAVPVDAAALRAGDIVTVKVGQRQAVFTHRIVRLAELPDGLHLETMGDANAKPDPSLIPATAVVGRVELTVPYAGFGVALLSSMPGILFLVSIAGVLLAATWLLESVEQDQREALRRRRSDEGSGAGVGGMTPDTGAGAGAA
jgi:signal peptidase I